MEKLAAYIEGFEKLEEELKHILPTVSELNEEEQIDLFQIAKMYRMDTEFRTYMRRAVQAYALRVVKATR
jgi:hypothetical protein